MRNKSQALLIALFMVVFLSTVASAATFDLTIRLEEDTVGFSELGRAAGDKWESFLVSITTGITGRIKVVPWFCLPLASLWAVGIISRLQSACAPMPALSSRGGAVGTARGMSSCDRCEV